ncbi:hypothetical protein AGMMS50249_5920 [candidate division SR1 bacterium]|nr:hypothetical protein AGMMS50249_5920 [candidate division SR1 bacterium]
MNYQNYNKKRKGGIIGAICIALALIMAVGALGYLSSGFREWDATKWFNREEQPVTLPADVTDNTELFGTADSVFVPDGASFRFAPMSITASGNTLSLTATVTPTTATNKAVDWAVAWANPASAWATGKTVTSYVTIAPTGDGALTATLTKVADFGEQVKVTCTSREDNTIKATSTVDLRKKVTAQSLILDAPSGTDFTLSTSPSSSTTVTPVTTTAYALNVGQTLSVGTLDDTYTTTVKLFVNYDLVSGTSNEDIYNGAMDAATYGITLGSTVTFNAALMRSAFSAYVWDTGYVYNALVSELNGLSYHFRIQVVRTGAYSTLETNFYFKLSSSYFSVKPTNLVLNDTSYIF